MYIETINTLKYYIALDISFESKIKEYAYLIFTIIRGIQTLVECLMPICPDA